MIYIASIQVTATNISTKHYDYNIIGMQLFTFDIHTQIYDPVEQWRQDANKYIVTMSLNVIQHNHTTSHSMWAKCVAKVLKLSIKIAEKIDYTSQNSRIHAATMQNSKTRHPKVYWPWQFDMCVEGKKTPVFLRNDCSRHFTCASLTTLARLTASWSITVHGAYLIDTSQPTLYTRLLSKIIEQFCRVCNEQRRCEDRLYTATENSRKLDMHKICRGFQKAGQNLCGIRDCTRLEPACTGVRVILPPLHPYPHILSQIPSQTRLQSSSPFVIYLRNPTSSNCS